MKMLRIVHGLSNNVLDAQAPPDFNLSVWWKQVVADGYYNDGRFIINLQWIQHVALMTAEEFSAMQVQGMAKN